MTITSQEPDIQIIDVDLKGDRELVLRHFIREGVPLAEKERSLALQYVRQLWGYRVRLEGVEEKAGIVYSAVAGNDE